MPGGEQKGQEIEKMMKENFPNLVMEINIQVQEAESLKQDGHKENHTTTHDN